MKWPKFLFKLQSILDIKLKLESQAKIAYGQANARLRKEEAALQMLITQRSAYEKRAVDLVNGPISIRDIRENKQSIDIMKTKIRAQMMVVHTAEKQVEAARLKLNEMMIERKTFENCGSGHLKNLNRKWPMKKIRPLMNLSAILIMEKVPKETGQPVFTVIHRRRF